MLEYSASVRPTQSVPTRRLWPLSKISKDGCWVKDPRNVEYLWATMYNFTRFPGGAVINAAMSGIEHALWDIAGKAAGLPVYMLLGGKCRDRVRVYRSAGGR